MADRIFLLSITFGGAPGGVLRLASRECAVVGDDGEYVFAGGLGEIIVREEMPEIQTIGAMTRVVVAWVSASVDVAGLEAAGHTFARAPAELALWEDGTAWESRRVLAVGRLTQPTYGEPGEQVKAAIEPLAAGASQIPDPSWSSNATDGSPMPVVFGRPGTYIAENGAQSYVAGVGLAGYVLSYAAVEATTAHVWEQGTDPSSGTSEAVFVGVDTSGGPYSSIATAPAVDSWVAMHTGSGIDGARSVADVLRVLHRIANVPVDASSLGEVAAQMDGWMIDGVIDEPTDLMTWVGAALLPILPLVAMPTANGWRYIVLRPHATPAEASFTIDVDTDPAVSFVGPVEVDDEVRGSLTIGWAWDLSTAAAVFQMVASADVTADVWTSDLADGSAPPWAHDSTVLYDRATVARALSSVAAMWGRRRITYTYLVPVDDADHLRIGDVVAIEHAALSLSGVAGQVVALEWSDDGLLGIGVRVWPEV